MRSQTSADLILIERRLVIFTSKGQFTRALAGEIDLYACRELRHFLVWEIPLLLRCQKMTQLGLNSKGISQTGKWQNSRQA